MRSARHMRCKTRQGNLSVDSGHFGSQTNLRRTLLTKSTPAGRKKGKRTDGPSTKADGVGGTSGEGGGPRRCASVTLHTGGIPKDSSAPRKRETNSGRAKSRVQRGITRGARAARDYIA